MEQYLRRLRGVVGLGLTWGVAMAAIFAAVSIFVWVLRPQDIDAGEGPIRVGAIGAGIGLLAGFAFGILLSLAERGKALRDIALSRAALWGILASAPFPLLTGRQDQVFVLCPIGAAVAIAAVSLARMAEVRALSQPARAVCGYVRTCVQDAVGGATQSST